MEKPVENLPWVEKYRPNALQELISHEDIIGTIRKFIQEDKLPHLVTFFNDNSSLNSIQIADCNFNLIKLSTYLVNFNLLINYVVPFLLSTVCIDV